MKPNYVWSSIGKLLMIIGCCMLIPAIIGIFYREQEYQVFLETALGTALVGALLYVAKKPPTTQRSRTSLRDSYAIVAYGWIVATVFGMLPYLLTGTFDTVTDAFFETMSGLTTVGASVLDDIEGTAKCVLLWRSLTHWLGGMGILVLFVALLTGQGTGAMQIFKAESSGPVKSKLQPKMVETARILWLIYVANTILVILLYGLAGMNLFDAVNHGFSAISTGGFSTKNLSIGYYDSAWIDWVSIFSMFIAGINYSLYFYAFRTKSLRCFWQSLELRVYAGVTIGATVLVAWFIAPAYQYQLPLVIQDAAFQVVSIITTTGFITCDFELWAAPAQMVLILLLLCGACAGSTTGGIKIDRHVILMQKAVQEIRRFLHPNMVTRLKSNNKPLDEDVVLSVTTFFYIYMTLIVVGTYLLCMLGGEMLDSLTAVMSCLGGVGPSIGAWGPIESYSGASVLSKWILSFLMMIGRLEIYTVLVLIRPFHGKWPNHSKKAVNHDFEEDGVIEPLVRDYKW